MKNSRPTQVDRILKYLADFGSITSLQAMDDLGVMRLAARISEMRSSGYDIRKEMITKKNRYGEPCSFAKYTIKL